MGTVPIPVPTLDAAQQAYRNVQHAASVGREIFDLRADKTLTFTRSFWQNTLSHCLRAISGEDEVAGGRGHSDRPHEYAGLRVPLTTTAAANARSAFSAAADRSRMLSHHDKGNHMSRGLDRPTRRLGEGYDDDGLGWLGLSDEEVTWRTKTIKSVSPLPYCVRRRETDRPPPLDLGPALFHERREVASVITEFLLKEVWA
jgi:hypothetical protein